MLELTSPILTTIYKLLVPTLWIMSGGVNPVEPMSGTEFLSTLPITATLKILAKEMVRLENLSTDKNLPITGAWSVGIVLTALISKIGIKHRA